MGLFQKKRGIEDLNNITQKVLVSNSYNSFDMAREMISPRFEKVKFSAPRKQVTSSYVQGFVDDLNKAKQEQLAQQAQEEEKQKEIIEKKAEALETKKEVQEFRLGFVNKKDQLSKELLEIRNNRDNLLNEKIVPLENEYEKLVNDHKSIFNIGNIFGDSSKIAKGATDQQKKEIEDQLNKNYADNNGEFYEAQFKLLGNIKELYDNIQQNKYLKQLQDMGEVPCEKIHDRKQELKKDNRELDEKLKGHYWLGSSKQKDQQKKEKNNTILGIYNAMDSDKHNGGNFIWQNFHHNQKQYLSNKNQNKSFIGKLLSSEVTSLYSNEALANEDKDLSNSTYFKNKTYNEARRKIIEEFEKNYKLIDEEDKKIGEKEKEIEEENKKIKEFDVYIKQLDEILNYTPSMAASVAGAIANGAEGFMDFISKKLNQNPITLIKDIKKQNKSIYENLSNPTVKIYKYLEKIKMDKKPQNREEFYNFDKIARYKVVYDNCVKWKNIDCHRYYGYIYDIMNSDSQLNDYIDLYYDKPDEKVKVLDLKNDMMRSTRVVKTTVSYAENCMDMGARFCKKMLEQEDDNLARTYKEMARSINSIYIYIGGNSSKEIKRNSKNYNNVEKFQKLKASKKENTLKVYDENLSLISNFKRLSVSLNLDLYNIKGCSFENSQKACQALIENIGIKQKQAQEFDEELKKRSVQIEKETDGIRDYTKNQANQKGIMKAFALPELPKSQFTENSNENDYLLYYSSYFIKIMEIDKQIKKNFSNNKKLFKENPYIANMWLKSMRIKVDRLKNSAQLKYNRFQGFAKTKLYAGTEKLYLQSMRQLDKYNGYFDDIEDGSMYENIDINVFFSRAFWAELRTALNEMVDLFQELGIEGQYKEIFRDISFTRVLKYSGSFIRFYKYWIKNISPQFLNFWSVLRESFYKGVDTYKDLRFNEKGRIKSATDGLSKFKESIDLLLFPEFFDTTKSLLSVGVFWDAVKNYSKIYEVYKCFGKIDKIFNAVQYETKRKYDEKKANSANIDDMYKEKLYMIDDLSKQNAKDK